MRKNNPKRPIVGAIYCIKQYASFLILWSSSAVIALIDHFKASQEPM